MLSQMDTISDSNHNCNSTHCVRKGMKRVHKKVNTCRKKLKANIIGFIPKRYLFSNCIANFLVKITFFTLFSESNQ